VLCGPGAPEHAHITGEHVDVSQIRDAIAMTPPHPRDRAGDPLNAALAQAAVVVRPSETLVLIAGASRRRTTVA
jgi:3-oxoacyl-(acyl-carrier-protein) synthase